jgi:hypothetical protein
VMLWDRGDVFVSSWATGGDVLLVNERRCRQDIHI